MKNHCYRAFSPFYPKIKSITCNIWCLSIKLLSLLQFGPLFSKYGPFLYIKPWGRCSPLKPLTALLTGNQATKVKATMLVSMSNFMIISFQKKNLILWDRWMHCVTLTKNKVLLQGKTDVKSFSGSNKINSVTFTMLLWNSKPFISLLSSQVFCV